MELKENDFVEIEYTGRIKESGVAFDTTDKKIAEDISDDPKSVAPVIICLGQGQIISGIDKYLIGKEPGKYVFDVKPEDGFGKKDAKLIQLIPTAKFKKQNIRPEPGLSVEIDGMIGRIRAVTGGRTIVDFNHPLSGLALSYDVNVLRVVSDPKEKVESIVKNFLRIDKPSVSVADGKATVTLEKSIPKELLDAIRPKMSEMAGIEMDFTVEKVKNNADLKTPVKKEVDKNKRGA